MLLPSSKWEAWRTIAAASPREKKEGTRTSETKATTSETRKVQALYTHAHFSAFGQQYLWSLLLRRCDTLEAESTPALFFTRLSAALALPVCYHDNGTRRLLVLVLNMP